MRRLSALGLIASVSIYSGSVLAQDARDLFFLPAKFGEEPKVINYATGEEKAVLAGVDGFPPANCPPEAYWMQNADSIVGCGDGQAYRLVMVIDPEKYPPGAKKLESLPRPPPNDPTDEPGPSLNKDAPKETP